MTRLKTAARETIILNVVTSFSKVLLIYYCSTVTSEDAYCIIRNVKLKCVIICLSLQYVYCF